MTLWFAFALMTAAAIFAVLLPLGLGNRTRAGGDARLRNYRHMQAEAAIRFCDVLFGREYSTLMKRAVENALTVERNAERKSSRTG